MNEIKSDSLICKPLTSADPANFLFSVYYPDLDAQVSLRSLDIHTDMDMLFDWVNQPYAKKFWQMNGARDHLIKTYKYILKNPHTHSYIGLINAQPSFQIDAYAINNDELKKHIDIARNDTGLHLLMAPPRTLKKGWSAAALLAFQDYYFSFPQAERLYGEPDRDNVAANQLSLRVGFEFLKEVQMSYKTANLYCITRSHFQIMRTSRINK